MASDLADLILYHDPDAEIVAELERLGLDLPAGHEDEVLRIIATLHRRWQLGLLEDRRAAARDYEALPHHGGEASVMDVSKYVWTQHEDELRASGALFYSWRYDLRWAAKKLRDQGKLTAADATPRGVWALTTDGGALKSG